MSIPYWDLEKIVKALEGIDKSLKRIADALDGGTNKDFLEWARKDRVVARPVGDTREGLDIVEAQYDEATEGQQYTEADDDLGPFETMVHNLSTHGMSGTDETVHPGASGKPAVRDLAVRFLNLSVTQRMQIAADVLGHVDPFKGDPGWSERILSQIRDRGLIDQLARHSYMTRKDEQ